MELPYQIFSINIATDYGIVVSASLPVIIGLLVLFFVLRKIILNILKGRLKPIKTSISLGNIGSFEIQPNYHDIQVAHQIWAELVTRKAAIPIDPEHDVIEEVYNSWYVLFTKIRELISEIPADLIRHEKSTKQLVEIATGSLNNGLRPHLTKWQAKYRNWYKHQDENLRTQTPQEVQKLYPHYEELVAEMLAVNELLIQYAKELKKIAEG